MRIRTTTLAVFGVGVLIQAAIVSAAELSGFTSMELRIFPESADDVRDKVANLSFVFQPEIYHEWDHGSQSLLFVPFLRIDEQDPERTHADVREMTWLKAAEEWELRVGVRKVFWGVTESVHLVDVLNQTDLVENIDGEDKLGQPMINLALIQDFGTIDVFILPMFRERTFPGRNGRLRAQPRVDVDRPIYQSSAEEFHTDFALRYVNSWGDWDVGAYHFWGTSREPRLVLTTDAFSEPVLRPVYDIINQTGLDVQATKGNWLWKLEAIRRSGQGESFTALATGFEYTFVGAFSTPMDVGLLAEYLYDSRRDDDLRNPYSPFQNDLFIGARFSLNDAPSTQALVGAIVDLDDSGRFFNVEASRRLGDRWKLSVEARIFDNIPQTDFQSALARDDYLQLELGRFF